MAWEILLHEMSNFLGLLLLGGLLISNVLAAGDYTHVFNLKKDQVAKISIIKKDYTSQSKTEGEMYFRWTLFHHDRLVLLVDYEGFPTQHVLMKEFKRDSVRVNLLGDYVMIKDRVYAILKFKEFASSRGEAVIEVIIQDPKKRIEVTFFDPKTK